MSRDWESTFVAWSKPPSDTEQEKCDNAENAIRDAIRSSKVLSSRSIDVFAQGSYRNNTNVRQDSDVDICVCCTDTIFYEFAPNCGFDASNLGFTSAAYTYTQYKDEVEQALVDRFGRKMVTRGNKAFDIHESAYRVDADVVACFEYRYYYDRDTYGNYRYLSGTKFLPDKGGGVTNYPKQHYENGVAKNKATGNRFKYITRILKRLRNEMSDNDVAEAKNIASYLIESLVWNCPDRSFGHDLYSDDIRYVLGYTFGPTQSDEQCKDWTEVNGYKYLFHVLQPWNRTQANDFIKAAWIYVGFN